MIDTSLMHKSILFDMMSAEGKEQARVEVGDLLRQRKEVDMELDHLRAAARGFAAQSLGVAINS